MGCPNRDDIILVNHKVRNVNEYHYLNLNYDHYIDLFYKWYPYHEISL